MADPKKNPLIGAFRAPVPGAPPDTPAPPGAEKPSAAGATKPADGKKGQEAPKAPAEEKESAGQPDTAKSQSDGISIVLQIPVDKIMENSPFVAAENDPTFQMLVEDIRINGLKVPIDVNRTADGKYEVIGGNRRLAAAKELGIKTINATVMNLPDKLITKGQLFNNLDAFVKIDAHKKIGGGGGLRPSGPAGPTEGKKSPVSDPGNPKDGKKQEASKAPADTSAKPKEQEPRSDMLPL